MMSLISSFGKDAYNSFLVYIFAGGIYLYLDGYYASTSQLHLIENPNLSNKLVDIVKHALVKKRNNLNM